MKGSLTPSENKTIEDGNITVEVWIIVTGWWKEPADTRVLKESSKVYYNKEWKLRIHESRFR